MGTSRGNVSVVVLVITALLAGSLGFLVCKWGDDDEPIPGGPPPFRRLRLFSGAKSAEKAVTVEVKEGNTTQSVDTKSTAFAFDMTQNALANVIFKDPTVTVSFDGKTATFDLDPLDGDNRYVYIDVSVQVDGDALVAHVVAHWTDSEAKCSLKAMVSKDYATKNLA
jgi:hypothetical protein